MKAGVLSSTRVRTAASDCQYCGAGTGKAAGHERTDRELNVPQITINASRPANNAQSAALEELSAQPRIQQSDQHQDGREPGR